MIENNFWCLNSSNIEELHGLLMTKHNIHFAITKTISPNIELKFTRGFCDALALNHPLVVRIGKRTLYISPLELQIAYKEEILKSNKDMEDAEYLRIISKNHVDDLRIKEYKK